MKWALIGLACLLLLSGCSSWSIRGSDYFISIYATDSIPTKIGKGFSNGFLGILWVLSIPAGLCGRLGIRHI